MAFTPNILRKCQLMTTKSNKTKNCWSFRLTYNQYLFLAFNLSIFLLYQPLRLIRLIYWLQLNKEEARLMRRHTHTPFSSTNLWVKSIYQYRMRTLNEYLTFRTRKKTTTKTKYLNFQHWLNTYVYRILLLLCRWKEKNMINAIYMGGCI